MAITKKKENKKKCKYNKSVKLKKIRCSILVFLVMKSRINL